MEFLPLLLQEYSGRLSRNDESLVELNLKCAGMNNHRELFQELLEKLKTSCTVQFLNLSANSLGSSINMFGSLFQENQYLRVLNLDKNALDCSSVTTLCRGLRHNSSIQIISFNDNHIGPQGGDALGGLLDSPHSSIRKLSLKRNRIGTRGVVAVLSGLFNNTCLQELALCNNGIMAPNATTLEDLDATRDVFEKLLRVNRSLKVLRLSCNRLGGSSETNDGLSVVASVGRGLQDNTTLCELDLSENGLKDGDVISLATCLDINRSLRRLHLDRNDDIGISGMKRLLTCIHESNWYMETITLHQCGHIPEFVEKLKKELSYWLQANQAGRRHVYRCDTTLPAPLWPLVLARKNSNAPNVLYCFLLAKPDLIMSFK